MKANPLPHPLPDNRTKRLTHAILLFDQCGWPTSPVLTLVGSF